MLQNALNIFSGTLRGQKGSSSLRSASRSRKKTVMPVYFTWERPLLRGKGGGNVIDEKINIRIKIFSFSDSLLLYEVPAIWFAFFTDATAYTLRDYKQAIQELKGFKF